MSGRVPCGEDKNDTCILLVLKLLRIREVMFQEEDDTNISVAIDIQKYIFRTKITSTDRKCISVGGKLTH